MARSRRSAIPILEVLDGRQLLSVAPASANLYAARVAAVRHEYHAFVSELQAIELRSQATPAEEFALRDDAKTISSSVSIPPSSKASARAVAVSIQLDRAAIDGWVGDAGWSLIRSRITANLDGLGVPQTTIDKTISDARALAESVGVTSDEYTSLTERIVRLRDDERALPSGYVHLPDPGLYYTQHLRGFFRGGSVQKSADEATLRSDIRVISTGSGATPMDVATLRRDARIIQSLAVPLTGAASLKLTNDYALGFADGPPAPSGLAGIESTLVGDLGTTATPTRTSQVQTLITDLPTFSRSTGQNLANVRTILGAIRAVVNDGAGSPLNPFRVQVNGGPSATVLPF